MQSKAAIRILRDTAPIRKGGGRYELRDLDGPFSFKSLAGILFHDKSIQDND